MLRKFGFNLALGMNILGCIMFYRHKGHFFWFSAIGSSALILALLYPSTLLPVKKILDRVLLCFNWLVSIITVSFAFYIIFTPIAILFKLLRRDLLSQKIDKTADSYWIKRKNLTFSRDIYEKMG